jgi:toxin ParE1/3/4
MAQGEDGPGPFSFPHSTQEGEDQMARKVLSAYFRTAAREDVLRQFRYYLIEKEIPHVAQRFLDAVESAVETLCRTPGIGAPKQLANPLLAGLRSWPVPGFPSVRIYYIGAGNELRVVRVLHGKRDIRLLLEEAGEQTEDGRP